MTPTSMRDAFGRALMELAGKRDDFVVLDADVAGGTGTAVFREAFPDRFIQCGIAEQNMMGVAAGLAATGIIPVVTCYAVFAAMRAVEQLRNSIAYPAFNVKVTVSHLGLDVGPDGATHQAIEDMAIIRAIPGMVLAAPADPTELAAALPVLLDHPGPVYLRTGRSPLPTLFDAIDYKIGKGTVVREGGDVTVMAVGVMVHRALEAADLLAAGNISCRVVNISTIKPLDKGLIEQCARETGCLVTAEDHTILGGLGGAVAEVVCGCCPVPVVRVGIDDRFGESGEPEDLARLYGLMPEEIARAAKKAIRQKRG